MSESKKNIDLLHNNTTIYYTRAKRTAYLAAVVNKNFVNSVAAAQVAIYEFVTGDKLSTNFVNSDASEVAKFALNCRNPDIVIDMRTLNARPRNVVF
jgi:hypothetical protein